MARIKRGLQPDLKLGNLEARRDWGYTPDYVRGMWTMLQQDRPVDYVLATGRAHTVRQLCELAFDHVGLDYRDYVVTAEQYLRPAEVDLLIGDASKAHAALGWGSRTSFEQLVPLMVDAELRWLQ